MGRRSIHTGDDLKLQNFLRLAPRSGEVEGNVLGSLRSSKNFQCPSRIIDVGLRSRHCPSIVSGLPVFGARPRVTASWFGPGLVRSGFRSGFGSCRHVPVEPDGLQTRPTAFNALPLTKEFRQAPPYLRSWTMPSFALPSHPSPCHPSPPSTPSSFPRLDFFCRLIILNIGHRFRGAPPPGPPRGIRGKR